MGSLYGKRFARWKTLLGFVSNVINSILVNFERSSWCWTWCEQRRKEKLLVEHAIALAMLLRCWGSGNPWQLYAILKLKFVD